MLSDDQVLALMDQQGNKLAAALKSLDAETALEIFLQEPHPQLSDDQYLAIQATLVGEMLVPLDDFSEQEADDLDLILRPLLRVLRRDGTTSAMFSAVFQMWAVMEVETQIAMGKALILTNVKLFSVTAGSTSPGLQQHQPQASAPPEVAPSVQLQSGDTLSWDKSQQLWVTPAGKQYVYGRIGWRVEPAFYELSVWNLIRQDKPDLPDRPAFEPPEAPTPKKTLHPALQGGFNSFYPEVQKLLKLMEKESGFRNRSIAGNERFRSKADELHKRIVALQHDYFRREGRWPLGVPPEDGWHPDPSKAFKERMLRHRKWTGQVRNSPGEALIDPDFPTT